MNGQITWPIDPGRGAGPLRLGMPIDVAAGALAAAGLGPIEPVQKGTATIYRNRPTTVHLYPAADRPGPETIGRIELILRDGVPLQAELFGQPLLGEPLDAVHAFLQSVDARAERWAYEVEAPGLGVGVWSDGDPPQWPVASVTVARPTPPARVIAPGFTFARLDRVAQSFGFTGGATTVTAPLVPGEPEVAEWSRRQILLRYTFDPVTFLRVIRLDGGEAATAPVVQRVMARLPLVPEEQVLADLASEDDETALRAIQAVGVLRLTAARGQLRHLVQEAKNPVRSAAISTLIGLPDDSATPA